jgi:hypothetical protein
VAGEGIAAAEECPTAGEAGPIDLDGVRLSALPFESCELLIVRILTRTHTLKYKKTINTAAMPLLLPAHCARGDWRHEEEEVGGEAGQRVAAVQESDVTLHGVNPFL